jgi:putative ATP-dependent endonuclease of the OLD family
LNGKSSERIERKNGYHARSFEDSFFELNRDFINEPANVFNAITPKHLRNFRTGTINSFDLSQDGVISKPSLAIEILINSITDANGVEFSNWQIPAYIKEALLWLKQD